MTRPAKRPPCTHRGNRLFPGGGCGGNPIYRCQLHADGCTVAKPRFPYRWCAECEDYEPRTAGDGSFPGK